MTDLRPKDCRFRLQDEGKGYPRSACTACGKTIMTGLGKECTIIAPPSPPAPKEDELTHAELFLLATLYSLEKKGMLYAGATELCRPGHDAGSLEVEMPGVVTYEGCEAVEEFHASGKTITG